MKKEIRNRLFPILFFSALWGFSEAALGGFLYRLDTPHASVYLTVIGFSILTVAGVYLPGRGVLSIIAVFAMLYKIMNTPFFACHLFGILLLGVCYDLFFNILRVKNRSVSAVLAIYAGYSLFALMMIYVFRYSHWVEAGVSKVVNHILISGTLAALGCVLAVPLSHQFGQWLRKNNRADFTKSFAHMRLAMVTTGMWLLALIVFVYHSSHV